MSDAKSTCNNFDLIRLFAAAQVAITHAAEHLDIHSTAIELLHYFPGVPVFFFISGYLIYRSYANVRGTSVRTFFTNRVLRLYPALVLCFALTLGSVWSSGYFATHPAPLGALVAWSVASLTFFQFYNPDFLRGYGTGAVNGSLWTIAVELQFYALTPLVYLAFRRYRRSALAIFALLVAANLANTFLNARGNIALKLVAVSFLPWLYMFVLGAYVSTDASLRARLLRIHPLVWLALYLASYMLAARLGLGAGNGINPVSYLLLSGLVLAVAHRRPALSDRILRKNDISYGVYIYHMPIVNLLLYAGIDGTPASLALALVATLATAAASWFCVEKPALALKKIALRSYRGPAPLAERQPVVGHDHRAIDEARRV